MASINFVTMQVLEELKTIGSRFNFPTKETFNTLESSYQFNDGDTFYEIEVEKTDEYVFATFNFGNTTPRDTSLTNINTGIKRENSRTDIEVELNNQFFFLYSFVHNLLYISNSTKKGILTRMFKEKLQKDIVLKDIYTDENTFLDKLKECTQISFTHINNLFSNNSTKKNALADLTGTDAPTMFTIKAKYSKHKISTFIRELFTEKKNNHISGLVINGINTSGFAVVYNTDSFAKKIKIDVDKDENGKFKKDEVRNHLLDSINSLDI